MNMYVCIYAYLHKYVCIIEMKELISNIDSDLSYNTKNRYNQNFQNRYNFSRIDKRLFKNQDGYRNSVDSTETRSCIQKFYICYCFMEHKL